METGELACNLHPLPQLSTIISVNYDLQVGLRVRRGTEFEFESQEFGPPPYFEHANEFRTVPGA